MKPLPFHLPGALACAVLTAPLMAASTTWFYGASDNSTTFGLTAGVDYDNTQAITWMDAWAGGGAANTNFFGSQSLQVNRPNMLGQGIGIMMFGFEGTGLSSADVVSASLYLRQDSSAPLSAPNTWNVVGIASGNTGWDTNTMTYNDINGAGAGDWTGGTLGGSLNATVYSTFQDLASTDDGNVEVDLTGALKAYLDGTISGIAFVNATNGTTFVGANYAFVPYSNDNTTATNRPGLLVTIPEPGSALLTALGLGLLTRCRRC